MFGYIGIFKPELKMKEFETFRAYYCGLCHTLKAEYSEAARLLLNYDCAFLYLLSDAIGSNIPQYSEQRCFLHPFKERHTTSGAGAEYAAAVNVLLGVESLRDHAADSGKARYKAASACYKKDYDVAEKRYPETATEIRHWLAELSALELQNDASIDAPANCFAKLLESIFFSLDKSSKPLCSLGYHLGRWIYLIDALDDFEKDAANGDYNPFSARFGRELTQEVRESAEFNLNASVSGAALALDLLDIKRHEGILKNIVYLGLYKKTEHILKVGKGLNGSI